MGEGAYRGKPPLEARGERQAQALAAIRAGHTRLNAIAKFMSVPMSQATAALNALIKSGTVAHANRGEYTIAIVTEPTSVDEVSAPATN